MNPSEHLTDIQIAAFSACTLPEGESREVGRHLLGCVNCRGLLPLPDPNSFWKAVMSEEGANRSYATSTDSPFRQFVGLFSKPGTLAWGTGTLVVLLSMGLLILFTVSKESDVAKSIEIENPTSGHNLTNEEPRIVLPHQPESSDSQSKHPARLSVGQELQERNDPRPKQNTKGGQSNSRAARAVNANISSTRGAISKCGEERTFEMQLGSDESDLVLKWERVPNAAKYHLYVSDDDEILIDEYETEKGTSYILKKPLVPNRAYKWKIIITLENGQTLNVDAQKFSAKDFLSMQKGSRSKRTKAATRCSASQ